MLDIKWIRNNQDNFNKYLTRRGISLDTQQIIQLDERRRQLLTLIHQLKNARNEINQTISEIKYTNNKKFEETKRDAEHLNIKINELELKLNDFAQLDVLLTSLPNILSDDVPDGMDSGMNLLLRKGGNIKNILNPKAHFELGVELKLMDFEQTVKMSGSRFVTFSGMLARLERALINFMLDVHTQELDFTEVSPPYIVKSDAMYNAGQLPKFDKDSFLTTEGYRLIPTGEVSLINMVYDKIIEKEELPLRLVAYTPCFRSEAGSHGRDTRGIIRLHQFKKVELVSITTPERSAKEHEYLLEASENIMKKLELPYRIMLLCSGDVGFCSFKTYDIEVWLPSQKEYKEIASCSNCTDFQARRLKARYKEGNENILVHTLNSSGLPLERTIAAIMENYQNTDGSISIPDVLVPYMNGISRIKKTQ